MSGAHRHKVAMAGLAVTAALILVVPSAGSAATAGSTATPAARAPITVGSLTLAPCKTSKLAWCTSVSVPLDYADPAAPHIDVYFEWFPATSGAAPDGTVLATEGGPGYPTTPERADYRGIFGPLLKTRNLLLVDLRGTGKSTLIKCKAVQRWNEATGTNQSYIDAVGACGRQLDHTWQRADGSYVPASDLFTTANSARDVDRILHLLRTGKIDFYGDSYGTFFGQTLTARFPGDLRSVTLDAAYPVRNQDPFYPDEIGAAHTAFNLSCARGLACHAAAPGASWSRIGALAARLRANPVTGRTTTPDGDPVTETVGVDQLIELVTIAGSDNGVYHDLDPAARALLDHGDAKPLLHLAAQEIDTGDSGAYADFSAGLYVAATCSDYPQPFRYDESVPRRVADYHAAVAALAPSTFAPFSVAEWTTEPEEEFDACEKWPAPVTPRPVIPTPPPYAPATLPVLVLSGDLDSLTTPIEGQRVAADMGPSARWILIHNDTHVNAFDDVVGCASGLVRTFVAAPGRLASMDASCAARTPEVRVVGAFPTSAAGVAPATASVGNTATAAQLRLAAIGTAVVGDAEWRWWYMAGSTGAGLRGGRYSFTGPSDAIKITFHDTRWTTDTKVNGSAIWNQDANTMTAHVTVAGPGGSVTVTVTYRDYVAHALATVNGSASGGNRVAATLPAP